MFTVFSITGSCLHCTKYSFWNMFYSSKMFGFLENLLSVCLISGLNLRYSNDLNFYFVKCCFCFCSLCVNPTLTGAMIHVAGCGYLLRCKSLLSWYTLLITFQQPPPCVRQCCGVFFRLNMGLGLPTRVTFFMVFLFYGNFFVPSWSPLGASEVM